MLKTSVHKPRTEKLVIKCADADLIKGQQAPHFIDTERLMFGWLQAVMTCAIPDRQHILKKCANADISLRPQQARHFIDMQLLMLSWLHAMIIYDIHGRHCSLTKFLLAYCFY